MKKYCIIVCVVLVSLKLVSFQKNVLLNSALKKACDIATQNIVEVPTSREKANIVKEIEEKWDIFSPTLEVNHDFKKMVVKLLKIMVSLDNYQLCSNISEDTKRNMLKSFMILNDFNMFLKIMKPEMDSQENSNINSTKNSTFDEAKRELVKETVTKIDNLLEKTLSNMNTTSNQEKRKAIDVLKKLVEESFKRKLAQTSNNKTSAFAEFISRGQEMLINKSVTPAFSRSNLKRLLVKEKPEETNAIERYQAMMDGIQHLVYEKPSTTTSFKLAAEATTLPNAYATVEQVFYNPKHSSYIGVSHDFNCDVLLKQTCGALQNIDGFQCKKDKTMIPIKNFCDGFVDCVDGTDEIDCVAQVTDIIHHATKILAEMNRAKYCYRILRDYSLESQQGIMLSSVLKGQIDFIDRYTIKQWNYKATEEEVHELVADVLEIVRNVEHSIKSAVCTGEETDNEVHIVFKELGEKIFNRPNQDPNKNENLQNSFSDCKCTNQYCIDNNTCSPMCRRVCYQAFSLTRFNCKPIKPEVNVGVEIKAVCDGKMDCADNSDEEDCLISPHAAETLFEEVMALLKNESISEEYFAVHKNLTSLQAAISLYQKRIFEIDNTTYRPEKETVFNMLSDIYLSFLAKQNDSIRTKEFYQLLRNVQEKMISAIKLLGHEISTTTVAPEEFCSCDGQKCTQENCTMNCIRQCFIRDKLTLYPCAKTSNNSIHFDFVCNGKAQCPSGEDEEDCVPIACRPSHLVDVRQKILELTEKFSTLGHVLDIWKEKTISRLTKEESSNKEKLTKTQYKLIIHDILNDLVKAYASSDELDGILKVVSKDQIVRKFQDLALDVMNTAKYCSK